MKPFLFKTAKLLLICLIVLYVLGLLAEYKLYRNTRDRFYVTQADWHLYHRNKPQVLFMGNSRMAWQVNVPQIINHFDVPMYNLSQDSRQMKELWYKFKTYVERNGNPRVLVLQCDASSLSAVSFNQETFFGKDRYLTYLFFDQLHINHLFKQEKGFHDYETYIPLIRYFEYPEHFWAYWNKKSSNPYESPNNYGSHLFTNDTIDTLGSVQKTYVTFLNKTNPNFYVNFNYLDSFKNYCDNQQLKLVLVFPPQSTLSYKLFRPNHLKRIDSFLNQRALVNRNFNGPRYADDKLFYNHMHLNDRGANLFTDELIAYLDSIGIQHYLTPNSIKK
ncbi:MAG: hypothetical protein ACR2IL_09680 [Chitinophagaceae bacterium]